MAKESEQNYYDAKIESLESKTSQIIDILDRLTRVEEQNQSTSKATEKNTVDLEAIKAKMWVVHVMGVVFICSATWLANQTLEVIDAAKKQPKQITEERIAEITAKSVTEALKQSKVEPNEK